MPEILKLNYFSSRSNVFAADEQNNYRKKTLKPQFNGVVIDYRMLVLLLNERGEDKFTICKENIFSVGGVFLTRKNFFGVKMMNQVMENFKSSGIISHFVDQQLSAKRTEISVHLPKALTLKQLDGTFQIFFFGLLVACLIFLIEFCSHCC